MKPIKLKMKGFMTFNEKTEIDFSAFGSSGLFLITGDTGAGKSTIFDAICYALFGKVSGNIRSGLNPVSDFLKEGEECFVELEFMHKNKSYIVKRNPDYMGRKAKRIGIISKNATLSFDGQKLSGNRQVTAKITEILGVDRNQFKQIAMLAQGEFMELLNASGDEREVILRKIFNTYLYDDFKNRLKKLRDDYLNQCRENDLKLIQSLKSADLDKTDLGFDDFKSWIKDGCDVNNAEIIISFISEINKSDLEKLSEIKTLRKKLDLKHKKAELELSYAQEDNKSFNELNKLKDERDKLDIEKISAQKKENKLSLIIKAKDAMPFYQSYIKEKNKLKDIITETEKNKLLLNKLRDDEKTAAALFEKSQQKRPEAERLSAEILKQKDTLADYDELEKLNSVLKERCNEKIDIEKNYKIIEDGINLLSGRLEAANEKASNLKITDADLEVIKNKYDNKIIYKNDLNELINTLNNIKNNKKIIQELEQDFIKAEKNYQLSLKQYEKSRLLFLSAQAGIMAKNLKDGEKCPVCGSVSHPENATKFSK